MDKHIRRLDADLARFENELKEKLEVSGYESPDGRGLKSKLAEKLSIQNSRKSFYSLYLIHIYECFAQRVKAGG